MKKIIGFCFAIVVSLTLAGCSTNLEKKQRCDLMGSGYIYGSMQGYSNIDSCFEKQVYCSVNCSRSIDTALSNVNDTRGNKGGFPDAVTEQFNLCVERCIAI